MNSIFINCLHNVSIILGLSCIKFVFLVSIRNLRWILVYEIKKSNFQHVPIFVRVISLWIYRLFFPFNFNLFNNMFCIQDFWFGLWFMVFNATFSNISVISKRSVLLVEETGVAGEKHRPAASHWNFITMTWCCIEYTSPWTGFELTTLNSGDRNWYNFLHL